MKKLLLASAVLVGMGASQAFADPSDAWTSAIDINVGKRCKIAQPVVSVGAQTAQAGSSGFVFSPTKVVASDGIDKDDDGLANQSFTMKLLFGQTFCNTTHSMTVARRFGGFTFKDSASNTTGSDKFLTAIPYKLTMKAGSWHSDATDAVNTGTTFSQVAYNLVKPYSSDPLVATGTSPAPNVQAVVTESSIPRFHNDGSSGGLNTTAGLEIDLDYAPNSDTESLPLLQGTYTESLLIEIAAN